MGMRALLLSLRAAARPARPFFFAASLLAFLAGCSTAPEVPGEDVYQAPPPGGGTATLRGSSVKENGFFGSEHRGFVTMIDYKAVPDASDHWDEPIVLHPGKRSITAEYRYSNFMTRAYVTFDAKPGANYQLMVRNSVDADPDGRLYNDFWIVDLATGKPVTPVFHRQLSGGKKGTIFYQNK
jgi:hypothetical protein